MSSSEAYILNQIQTPNALGTVYQSITDGNTTEEEIAADTCLEEGSLSEVLSGLVLLGMVRKANYLYEPVDLEWDSGNSHRDFQLTALGNLADEATGDNWGKQAVVLLNYEYLIKNNKQEFENNETALYESIDNWLEDTTSYRPKKGNVLYSHNQPKFGNWTRLVHFLGLVNKVSGRQYILSPDPEIIHEAIKRASESITIGSTDGQHITILDYLEWLHDNLLRIGYEVNMSVPAVLSHTFLELIRTDKIRIIERGDARTVQLDALSADAHPTIDKDANSIKIL